MSERNELVRDLRAVGAELTWPATPDVAAGLGGRLAADPPRAPRATRWRLALAAVLVFVIAASAAVPPVRGAIARVLGIAGGERIDRVERVPGNLPPLGLGRPVTLSEASAGAGFEIRLPRSLGAPDGIWLGGDLGRHAVSLLYGSHTILTETARTELLLAVKQIAGQDVQWVEIGGGRGYWIARGPRAIAIPDGRDGAMRMRASLPGSGLLLWNREGVSLRLETTRSLDEALAIARSVR